MESKNGMFDHPKRWSNAGTMNVAMPGIPAHNTMIFWIVRFSATGPHDLMKRATWFVLLADNVYEILFFLAALITAYAFFALIIRRRVRAKTGEDEEDEDSDSLLL
jgi:surface polysaccharide O-acyltransferase-like enzyme